MRGPGSRVSPLRALSLARPQPTAGSPVRRRRGRLSMWLCWCADGHSRCPMCASPQPPPRLLASAMWGVSSPRTGAGGGQAQPRPASAQREPHSLACLPAVGGSHPPGPQGQRAEAVASGAPGAVPVSCAHQGAFPVGTEWEPEVSPFVSSAHLLPFLGILHGPHAAEHDGEPGPSERL